MTKPITSENHITSASNVEIIKSGPGDKNINEILQYSPTLICSTSPAEKNDGSHILGLKTTDITAVGSVLTATVSIFLAFATIKKYSKDHRHQLEILKINKQNDLIQQAKEKIEHFYGPCNALLEESRVIYTHFALQEKSDLRDQNSYFRTLRYLTEPREDRLKGYNRFKLYDQKLLEQICNISDQTLKLIEEKSGYIDNPDLHTLLGKLTAHYRVLKLASKGDLDGLDQELETVVFPLEINGAIDNEINKLLKLIKPNTIIKNINYNKTIEYYDSNYIEYHQNTHSLDMIDIYRRVRSFISNGSRVLDAGCGSGRDTHYFLQHGFKVISFDASKKMTELCNEYPFAYCEQQAFNTINYASKFDLVWACASLLHLNEEELKTAFYNLFKSLKKDGHLYFSLKPQHAPTINDTRIYFSYDEQYIHSILIEKLKMTQVDFWITSSSLNSNDEFHNYIFKK